MTPGLAPRFSPDLRGIGQASGRRATQDISDLSAKIEAVQASQQQAQVDFANTGIEAFQKLYDEKVLEER